MTRIKCISDFDFRRCMVFQRKLEVWIDMELDTIGIIE
ncbi:MAG: hypothetical protein JWM44_33 [Bacilli bacterium]|nr:hypothetical protein [Bacilli bacterium]